MWYKKSQHASSCMDICLLIQFPSKSDRRIPTLHYFAWTGKKVVLLSEVDIKKLLQKARKRRQNHLNVPSTSLRVLKLQAEQAFSNFRFNLTKLKVPIMQQQKRFNNLDPVQTSNFTWAVLNSNLDRPKLSKVRLLIQTSTLIGRS